ncbi:MAG TPA: IclR family transcriptional regulator [Bradyrhizobium sp.]
MVNRKLPAPVLAHIADADDATGERYRAPALDKGLDILELLSATEAGLTQAEIAKALERSANEIYRMLDRLVRRGYVMRTEAERYELSLKLFALAHQHAPLRRLVAQATPIMRRFVQEAGQSCHLVVYERGRAIVVAQLDAPSYWGLAIRVGAHVGLIGTGSGHVLLAFQSLQERQFMLSEHEAAAGEAPAPADLEQRLAAIRARGHEIMPSRQTGGVLNISAPVLAPDGSALAAVTCPYIERIDDAASPKASSVARMLVALGRELSLFSGAQTASIRAP